MRTFEIKYRGYWGNTVGYSTVKAECSKDAKAQVSSWGFVLECDEMPQCKNCGIVHDGRYVFLRSSGCCSITCEKEFTRERLAKEVS